MNVREFQHKYHNYAETEANAKEEAVKVNAEGVYDSNHVREEIVAVGFGDLGWALMLKRAADNIKNVLDYEVQR